MDNFEIAPFKNPVTATIEIPGSKSYTNRALIMAALTKGPVTLYNPLYSEDTEAMIACLKALGLHIDTSPNQITIYDDISEVENTSFELHTKDSGTTLRFLLALLCLTPGSKTIGGSEHLNQRPIRDLVDVLRYLGAKIDYLEKEGQAPLKISSSTLNLESEVTINASVSSQFVSALLMISPFLKGIKIHLLGNPISKPYIDMTIQTMREWGVEVLEFEDKSYYVPLEQHYNINRYEVEGDFSSAGYFFAIAALTKSTITLRNLNPLSKQADRKFLDILAQMGNTICMNHHGITVEGKKVLPLSVDMEGCPDQVQTLAVLAAFAKGVTTISGVRSLRVKETERVQALKTELAKMGIHTEDSHDTLTIFGGNPQAACIDTYGDHRMAMAFAVAGTKLAGINIRNPEVVKKTFPTFWEKLRECT